MEAKFLLLLSQWNSPDRGEALTGMQISEKVVQDKESSPKLLSRKQLKNLGTPA